MQGELISNLAFTRNWHVSDHKYFRTQVDCLTNVLNVIDYYGYMVNSFCNFEQQLQRTIIKPININKFLL